MEMGITGCKSSFLHARPKKSNVNSSKSWKPMTK